MIAAQDATYIAKSGKKTHGLAFFWNGSSSKAEKGLELDTIAVIQIDKDGDKKTLTISAEQTPANPLPKEEKKKSKKSRAPTRTDAYLKHTKTVSPTLLMLGVRYITVDGYFAKEKYVNGVVDAGLHIISKMRIDFRLRHSYCGPQKSRPKEEN